jgi:hypothetical protein
MGTDVAILTVEAHTPFESSLLGVLCGISVLPTQSDIESSPLHVSYACHITHPSHGPQFDNPHDMWREV